MPLENLSTLATTKKTKPWNEKRPTTKRNWTRMQSVVFGSSHLPDKTRKRRSSLQFVMAQSNDLIWPPHWSSWCYSLPQATAFEAARSMLFIIELFSCLCTDRATTMYYMRGRRRRRWGPWCQLPCGLSMMGYPKTSWNLRKPLETSGTLWKPLKTSGNLRKPTAEVSVRLLAGFWIIYNWWTTR